MDNRSRPSKNSKRCYLRRRTIVRGHLFDLLIIQTCVRPWKLSKYYSVVVSRLLVVSWTEICWVLFSPRVNRAEEVISWNKQSIARPADRVGSGSDKHTRYAIMDHVERQAATVPDQIRLAGPPNNLMIWVCSLFASTWIAYPPSTLSNRSLIRR